MRMSRLLPIAIILTLAAAGPVAAADDEAAEVRAAFEGAVRRSTRATWKDSSTPCTRRRCRSTPAGRRRASRGARRARSTGSSSSTPRPTRGSRRRTRSTAWIGDTGIAYGEYALSVNYNGQGRQTVHEGRYTMTYTRVGNEWRIAMQHNTPAGEAPQPVRNLRPESR